MKKVFFIAMLFVSVACHANDTIRVNNANISKVIVDNTVNTKGKKVVKYYFIYNGELVSTSKTVIDNYNLCKKYGAKCALALVKSNSRKRIILD